MGCRGTQALANQHLCNVYSRNSCFRIYFFLLTSLHIKIFVRVHEVQNIYLNHFDSYID